MFSNQKFITLPQEGVSEGAKGAACRCWVQDPWEPCGHVWVLWGQAAGPVEFRTTPGLPEARSCLSLEPPEPGTSPMVHQT